jgi:hypothetical protein
LVYSCLFPDKWMIVANLSLLPHYQRINNALIALLE